MKFIYPVAKAHHCGILTYENNEIITEMPENRYIQLEAAINKMKVKKVDSLVEYIDIPVPKFLIVQDGDYLAEVEKLMAASLGDSYNDITMLQYAGLGIAMENGRDIVRDTADFITLSNDKEGIVYAVEKILAGLI